jgi:DNA-binding MarR family transcriptional regulator
MNTDQDFNTLLEQFVQLFGQHIIRNIVALTKETGLSMPQINVLLHLYYIGSSEISNIKNFIAGDFVAATQIVDRLVQRGLVVRSRLPEDRRVRIVNLTPEGIELVQMSINSRREWIRYLSGQFSGDEKAALGQAIPLLINKMQGEH